MDPKSPEAQIFYQLAKGSDKSAASPGPAPTPSGTLLTSLLSQLYSLVSLSICLFWSTNTKIDHKISVTIAF